MWYPHIPAAQTLGIVGHKYIQLRLHFVFKEKSCQFQVLPDFCQLHQIFIHFTFTKLCYLVISPHCDLGGLTPYSASGAAAWIWIAWIPSAPSVLMNIAGQMTRSPVQSCILLPFRITHQPLASHQQPLASTQQMRWGEVIKTYPTLR